MTDAPAQPKVTDDDLKNQAPAVPSPTTTGVSKETEPKKPDTEEEILSEIVTTSEAADEQAEKAVQENLEEIKRKHGLENVGKLSQPKPKIPADVADAGVRSPQDEADAVVKQGTTLEVELSEAEYKDALEGKAESKTSREKVVFGPRSVVALAIWVGKMIKLAHQHAMRIVFRRGNAD